MIVNATQNGWKIIYHRAHALLAAQLAGQWRRKDVPVRFYETLAAISHHDDLEKEWEEENLTEAGAPRDFTLHSNDDAESGLQKVADLAKNALYRGRWVALLISMHISRLHEPRRGKSAKIDRFLDEQLQNQQRWREELGIEKSEVDAAYAFMQWCDRLSLILCQQELPADERFLEISKGPSGQRYDIMQRRDQLVTVKPWPFEEEQFTVNIEACEIFQAKFETNAELSQALQEAPINILEWTFVKS
ncbi:DUF3891 family protein [Anabaena cylindrica FACHB-243]|uniref:DUF3891 family protein n=1 Tax=Anabaena TaxID=1163 RepID=UPI0005AAC4D3|nr:MULTISPECIES: DUF3891 family protein [Anabaena]MBD2421098.1 DUF3891 family protein [Anabaena cylindrica FACHB-243]MBY5284114.1 DUF3891 family protein [Anabaena sp. CCAP 1446/1C]MBY5310684.1 DUF3891 family protein [Anabaena sp. CCAP 1446/1C]MCM2405851.1 DUF3891 family protein [Anabaena sp. CCAP 1446/1C]